MDVDLAQLLFFIKKFERVTAIFARTKTIKRTYSYNSLGVVFLVLFESLIGQQLPHIIVGQNVGTVAMSTSGDRGNGTFIHNLLICIFLIAIQAEIIAATQGIDFLFVIVMEGIIAV